MRGCFCDVTAVSEREQLGGERHRGDVVSGWGSPMDGCQVQPHLSLSLSPFPQGRFYPQGVSLSPLHSAKEEMVQGVRPLAPGGNPFLSQSSWGSVGMEGWQDLEREMGISLCHLDPTPSPWLCQAVWHWGKGHSDSVCYTAGLQPCPPFCLGFHAGLRFLFLLWMMGESWDSWL